MSGNFSVLGNDLEQDPRWQLAQRVAASPKLRRSRRLQDLLMFITERALRDSGVPIREQEIGSHVFERSADFDTADDTIVRVHTFQLRKRLKEYFETEGIHEPIVIEIPKGSYSPEFIQNTAGDGVVRNVPARQTSRALMLGLAAANVALLAICCLLWWEWKSASNMPVPKGGSADSFWTQMFGNGQPTDLVLADASVGLFQDLLGRHITVQQYQLRQVPQLADSMIADPARRDFAKLIMMRHLTPFTSAVAARNLGLAAARNHVLLDVVFARDFSARHMESNNVILEGNRRTNPWMSLFEERLNFRYEFDFAQNSGYFRNVRPLAGEEPVYRVAWDSHGYCLVAHLPNLSRSGTVLILAGTDLSSAEAGARFATGDQWISRLRERLKVKSGAPMPYFEVLLKTDLLIASTPRFEFSAVRAYIQ